MPRDGIVLSTYLLPAEAAVIRARAEAADRTTAAELRRIIRRHLAQYDESPAGRPSFRSDSGVEAAGDVAPER